MKNPRHLFILLGFIAQGLTWENYFLLLVVFCVWRLAVALAGRIKTTLTAEAIALVVGCVLSILVNWHFHRSAHFFLGDGLICLQLVRITREVTRREKFTSLVIAAFHFGVLCTLAPDIRFVILFGAAIFLFPGALKEVTQGESLTPAIRKESRTKLIPSMRVALWLILGSIFVFITFPRFTGSPLQLREGLGDQGSLLDSILDPRKGGRANSQQVLMQIEGDQVGYLRSFALTEFDGITWWTNPKAPLFKLPYPLDAQTLKDPRYKHRRILVKNSLYLGKIVPVDGRPVAIKRNFFEWPFENKFNGALECAAMWTTGNNVYDYWIDSQAEPQELSPEVARHLTYHPEQSKKLKNWLADATKPGTNTLNKARLLEVKLRNQFTYKIGTPELNRLAPVDDLIFNRQEGHCERFASAMALFLRMQGIPSRVVVGYVAATRNLFSGRLQVRFRDAHSWTEGYFAGLGWVTFDATPGPPPGGGGSDLMDFIEALDFAWYSHVVNFNGFAQKELIGSSIRLFDNLPSGWTAPGTALFLVLLTGAIVLRLDLLKRFRATWDSLIARRRVELKARHYYEEMLNLLRARGINKAPQQTPFEFLEVLQARKETGYNDAALVTQFFCETFYGEKRVQAEEQDRARLAVARLKDSAAHGNNYDPKRN